MSSLTGTKIKDTYDGLLKTTDNGALDVSGVTLIEDGLGNASALSVGRSGNGVTITGSLNATLATAAQPNITSVGTLSSLNVDLGTTGTVAHFEGDATDALNIDMDANAVVLDARNVAYLGFEMQGSERMRITSGGYLKASNNGSYVNTTGPYHELYNTALDSVVNITNSHASSPYGAYIRFDANPNNTTNWFLRCASQGGVSRFFVYSNGNVANTNNSYGAISDAKLKENVVDASPKLDDLMQVQVRNYNLIGDNKKQLGVVAQELETIFPSMIDETPDFEEREVELRDENGEIVYETEQVLVSEAIAEELDADGNVITPAQEAVYETVTTDRPVMTTERVDLGTTTKSVKYSVFVPILVKAMQEQQEIINKLEARIAALEAK